MEKCFSVEGVFVVNLGDMLQKWTNGLYKSTMHRVVMDGEEDRYSIPFFFEPNVHCRVKPVVVREGEGVREEEIVSGRESSEKDTRKCELYKFATDPRKEIKSLLYYSLIS